FRSTLDEHDLRGGIEAIRRVVAAQRLDQVGPAAGDVHLRVLGGRAAGRARTCRRPAVAGGKRLPADPHGLRRHVTRLHDGIARRRWLTVAGIYRLVAGAGGRPHHHVVELSGRVEGLETDPARGKAIRIGALDEWFTVDIAGQLGAEHVQPEAVRRARLHVERDGRDLDP